MEPDRRQAIIEAALRVFAAQGFHKASIKQIAAAAGLRSPSLIYWYFKDKHELLQAVSAELSPLVRQAADPAELMDRPPAEVLTQIMQSYYRTLDHPDGVRLARLLLAEAIRTSPGDPDRPPVQVGVVRFVTAYLERQIALGRLRRHDPQVAARAFLGAMFAYLLSHHIMPELAEGLPDRDTYIREVVATFLDGLQPAGAAGPADGRHAAGDGAVGHMPAPHPAP